MQESKCVAPFSSPEKWHFLKTQFMPCILLTFDEAFLSFLIRGGDLCIIPKPRMALSPDSVLRTDGNTSEASPDWTWMWGSCILSILDTKWAEWAHKATWMTQEKTMFCKRFLLRDADIERTTRYTISILQAWGRAGLTLAYCLWLTLGPDLAVYKPCVFPCSYGVSCLENTQQLCIPQSIVH